MAIFKPTYYKRRLTDLTVAELKNEGIHTLLLDVDNTLSTHHNPEPDEGIPALIDEMKREGIGLIIVSNSRRARVEPFAQKLGVDFFYLCKKPLPFRLNKAIKQMGADKKGMMLCGDQIFTDMPAGNLCGVKTLLLEPIEEETGWSFRVRRKLERPMRRRYKEKVQ